METERVNSSPPVQELAPGPISGQKTLDQATLDTLRQLHNELELDDEIPYEEEEGGEWEDIAEEPNLLHLQTLFERLVGFTEKLYNKFKRLKKSQSVEPVEEQRVQGDELIQQLIDAWNLYTRGSLQIPCRDIGYILRILGQNPTEDDIVEMVMKANCDWEGIMTREDFLQVGEDILRSSCNQMDDVLAAFRVFDHNNDGSISKEELREAMVNFGERVTEEEFAVMFAEADKNKNGRIDFDEFVDMMLPSANKPAIPRDSGGPMTREV